VKVPTSVRDVHAHCIDAYRPLKERVDDIIVTPRQPRWHYESRLKELESYALKLETGRVSNPTRLEDFFACTIVVDNLSAVDTAEKMVTDRFRLVERRPESLETTTKCADCFRFDDTRLYVEWHDDPRLPRSELHGMPFEVQIKTFLAHAWSIATHDLILKANERSWPRERIAYQVKAMLEHAETSIFEARRLAESKHFPKTDRICERTNTVIRLLSEMWDDAALPSDRRRLAENVDALLKAIGMHLDSLRTVLESEAAEGRGPKTLNLSPYATIIQSIFNQEPDALVRYISGKRRTFKILLPPEVELPPDVELGPIENAVVPR